MGNNNSRSNMVVNSFNELEDGTIINQGTSENRLPQLVFHQVHGANISLQHGNRIAKRNESFCKGLAFSNRPIGIDENVCIRQSEVSTSWSGVLRFGVTNIDPDTYRGASVPKFACPDLTSKEGYWAKALPERHSVEGHILHFSVNSQGELFYGINGQSKGLFLMGINTSLPLWVIIDIYGNSVAVEFVDPGDFRRNRNRDRERASLSRAISAVPTMPVEVPTTASHSTTSSTPGTLSFHRVTGRHITLNSGRMVATRAQHEYSHGYVFTERPINNNEKVTIQILRVIELYHGGLAFGLTCRDPSTLRGTDLPADSSDLIELPEYWVGIKDVAVQPAEGSKLSFWVTDRGEVKFEKDNREARTIMHVDNSLQLYFYFDVYGSTHSIKLIGSQAMPPRSRSPNVSARDRVTDSQPTHVVMPRRELNTSGDNNYLAIRMDSAGMRMSAERDRPPVPRRNTSAIDDLLTGPSVSSTPSTLPPPLAPTGISPTVSALMSPRPAPPPAPRSHATPSVPPPLTSRPPPSTPAPMVPRRPPIPLPGMAAVSPPVGSAPAFAPVKRFPDATSPLPNLAGMAIGGSSSTVGKENVDEEENECTICMSEQINSVIYTCGHMCMCYKCAIQTKEMGHGCPICRQPMQDVIKIFKS